MCVPAPQLSTADRTRLPGVFLPGVPRLPPVLQMLVIQVVQMLPFGEMLVIQDAYCTIYDHQSPQCRYVHRATVSLTYRTRAITVCGAVRLPRPRG